MDSVAPSSATYRLASSAGLPTVPRSKGERSTALRSTPPKDVRTKNRPQITPARLGQNTCHKASAHTIGRPQALSNGLPGSQIVRLARTEQNPTPCENAQKTFDSACEASVDVPGTGGVPPRSSASDVPTSIGKPEGAERQQTGTRGSQVRAVGEDGQSQVLNANAHLGKTTEAPSASTAIEPFTSSPRSSHASTRSTVNLISPLAPISPLTRSSHTPLISARPSTRPSIVPHVSAEPSTRRPGTVAGPLLSSSCRRGRVGPVGAFRPEYTTSPDGSGIRSIKVGIETEFYLAARNPANDRARLEDFVTVLAKNYNQQIPPQHPRMLEKLRAKSYAGPYEEWCLVPERTLRSNRLPCKSHHFECNSQRTIYSELTIFQGLLSWYHQSCQHPPSQHGGKMWK